MATYDHILRSDMTVSGKIRALDAAGVSRADIARLIGRKYQHVRNVLEGDKQKAAQSRRPASYGVAETAQPFEGPAASSPGLARQYRITIQADGAISLPEEASRLLGLQPGGVVICSLEPSGLLLQSAAESLRRLRELVPPWRPGEPMWSEELIAERRREAELEEQEALRQGRVTGE